MDKYPEMKKSGISWAETIPSTWNVRRGKTILSLLNRPIKDDDEIITCFRDGEVTLRKNRREDGFTVALQENGYQGIEPGDLVVHGMDGFAGSIGISDSRGKATPVLNVMDSTQNKRFLMYYLRALAFKDVFMSLSTGIRVRSCDLRWNKLAILPFVLPSLDEQQAIAAYLDDQVTQIDSTIAEAQASIEEYKQWKNATVFEGVTKGLDDQASLRETGIDIVGKIPVHWGIRRLKFLCDISTGNQDTQDAEPEGEYPFYVRSPIVERSNHYTYDGEGILMAGDGAGAGRVFHHAFGKYAIHQRVYCLHNFRDIETRYLYHYMSNLFSVEMDKGSAKSTVPSVRLPMLLNFRICLPPKEEQIAIADYLDTKAREMDSVITEKIGLIDDLETYKRSLIYEAVTGKRKVV